MRNGAICLVSVGSALALLVIGIITGLAVVMSGAAVLAVSGLIVIRHRPAYITHCCGMRGERVLRDHLHLLGLSDEYIAYYNLPIKDNGRISDIDCILVGPSGLFVFEVKHHHGLIFYRNGIWAQLKVGRRGNPYAGRLGDPSGQLSRNIRRLKGVLQQADSHSLWLHGTIAFTNPRATLDIEGLRWTRAVPVKDLGRLISRRMTLSTGQMDRINACLAAFRK